MHKDEHMQGEDQKSSKHEADKCPRCKMSRDQWPDEQGVSKGGKVYCCQGCASNTGCTS